MATWYYYDANGEKVGPVRGRKIKQLALQGAITPETILENEKGKTSLAGHASGLTFAQTVQTAQTAQAVQPAPEETYDTPPPIDPNPFSAPPPGAANSLTAPAGADDLIPPSVPGSAAKGGKVVFLVGIAVIVVALVTGGIIISRITTGEKEEETVVLPVVQPDPPALPDPQGDQPEEPVDPDPPVILDPPVVQPDPPVHPDPPVVRQEPSVDPDPPVADPRIQQERAEFAEKTFSHVSLNLSEAYRISDALQYYDSAKSRGLVMELRGQGAEELAKASREKNWLKMISLLEEETYTEYPDAKTIDSAVQKLQGDRLQMLLKGNFVGLPLDQIQILSFYTFDTVLRTAGLNDVQSPEDIGNNGNIVQYQHAYRLGEILHYTNLQDGLKGNAWKRHPDGAGYYSNLWSSQRENKDVVGNYVEITRNYFVLGSSEGIRKSCEDWNGKMQSAIIRLHQRIKLGETTRDQAIPLLKKEYDQILAAALERCRKR